MVFGDGHALAMVEAVAVGIRPSQADLADQHRVFIEVHIIDEARDQDHGDGEEQRKSQAQGGVLPQQT